MKLRRVLRLVLLQVTSSLWLLIIVDVLSHLPNLHDVVLGHRADNPGIIGVPGKIGDLGRVASVDEEELRRTIFGVLGTLLLTNLGEIPDMKSAVSPRAGQDSLVMRGPLAWKISSLCDSKL